jgi:hypothetical protein
MTKGMEGLVRSAIATLVVVLALGWLGLGEAQAAACNESVPGFSQCVDMTGPTNLDQPLEGDDGFVVSLLDFSMGVGGGETCYFCTFSQEFLVAIAAISSAVFDYLRQYFVVLMPMVLAVWMCVRALMFFGSGSEDGFPVLRDYALKGGLFFLLWIVMLPSGVPSSSAPAMTPTSAEAPWTWAGPEALRWSFQLFGDLREAGISGLTVGDSAASDKVGFNCRGSARGNATLEANPGPMAFAYYSTEAVCTIERTHFMAIAVGFAMATGGWGNVDLLSFSVLTDLFQALFMSIFGFILVAMACLSLVWFVFHILEVVVKFLFIAAVLPILLLFGFLAKTRSYLFAALRQMVGGVGVLFGLAFSTSLGFYLIANTVSVYNASIPIFDPSLLPIRGGDLFADLREFVRRVGLDGSNPMRIPMSLGSPWYIYLLIVMYSNYALGKKITKMIEGITGARALTEMADAAKRMAAVSGLLAVGGGVVGLKAAGSVAGGTAQGANWVGSRFAAGFRGAKEGLVGEGLGTNPASINPFGAAAHALRGSLTAGRKASAVAGQALNATDNNPPPQ